MTIKEIFEHERYLAATCSAYMPWGVEEMLDRIENAVEERIDELETALGDILAYVTIETPPTVVEIINGVLNKEEK